jgi:D-alanyl-D-alanine carboxypeptidase
MAGTVPLPDSSTARSVRRYFIAIIAAGIVITACTGADDLATPASTAVTTTAPTTTTQPAPTTTAPVDRDDALSGLIAEWAADNDPVGVAAAVRYPDGELWLGAAGLADRERAIPIAATGRFEIASITKTFMAALTLRLAEEGLVDLDTPIATYLPTFPEADAITLRQLLGHRAGVYDPTSELVTDRFGPPDPERVFTPHELVEAAMVGTPTFAPGTSHDYSNAGYWVLAAALEAATGESTATLLDRYIIEPMGLTDTLLYDPSVPDVEVVNAYKDLDLDGSEDPMGTVPLPGFITPAWTAGGMISTASDLVVFLDGLFSGAVITEASLEEMLDTSSGGGSYALGIYRAGRRWGHDGGIAGYLSAVFHDPTTGVTVAVLTNRFGPDAPQADALAPELLAAANRFAGSG